MNPLALTRKLPDGRTSVGPLFFIIVFLLIIAFFLYLNFRNAATPANNEAGPIPVARDKSTVNVGPLANAGRAVTDVQSPEDAKKNGKLSMNDDQSAHTSNGSGFLDTQQFVKQHLSPTEQAARNGPREPQLNINDTTSHRPRNGDAGGQNPNLSVNSLEVFDQAKNGPAPPVAAPAPPVKKTGFEDGHFMPRGELIPVYFLSQVNTTTQENMVILGVAENVIFNHRVQIPYGTRIIATSSSDSNAQRIAINADTMIFPDGQELPLSGLGVDIDRMAGVRGYYVPQPLWVTLMPYINSFTAAYIQQQASLVNTQNGPQVNSGNSQALATTAASQAITQQLSKLQSKLDNIYPDYTTIPVGTAAFIQIRSPLDLEARSVAGSLNSTMPILPGFQNNPILANGQLNRANQQGQGGPGGPGGYYNPQGGGYYNPQGGGYYNPQGGGYYNPQGGGYNPQGGYYNPQGVYPQNQYNPQNSAPINGGGAVTGQPAGNGSNGTGAGSGTGNGAATSGSGDAVPNLLDPTVRTPISSQNHQDASNAFNLP